jgi:hypothetical protein
MGQRYSTFFGNPIDPMMEFAFLSRDALGQRYSTFFGNFIETQPNLVSSLRGDYLNIEELDTYIDYKKLKSTSSPAGSSAKVANQGNLCPPGCSPSESQHSLAGLPVQLSSQDVNHESVMNIGDFFWDVHQLDLDYPFSNQIDTSSSLHGSQEMLLTGGADFKTKSNMNLQNHNSSSQIDMQINIIGAQVPETEVSSSKGIKRKNYICTENSPLLQLWQQANYIYQIRKKLHLNIYQILILGSTLRIDTFQIQCQQK